MKDEYDADGYYVGNKAMLIQKKRPLRFDEPYPIFNRISIETTKTCTRACVFCPSSERGPIVETMSDELYGKILKELRELKWVGTVQWFFLNEPLLDKQHLHRIVMLRAASPKSTIHVTTNWDIYHKQPFGKQLERIQMLFDAGVNSLNLNDYSNRGYQKLIEGYSLIDRDCEIRNHTWQRLSPKKRVLSSGPLPRKYQSWTGYYTGPHQANGRGHCARPMRHIVVQWNGIVPVCCAVNPVGAKEYGDINKQSLVEVWNGLAFFEKRLELQDGNRLGECSLCNCKSAYGSIARRVTR